MPRILVIEDNQPIRVYVYHILSTEGYEVLEADDGSLGISMAEELLPDLIICDIMLPNLNGYEILRHLRSILKPDQP